MPFAVDIGPTVPCSICGRSFAEDRIEKHGRTVSYHTVGRDHELIILFCRGNM